MSEVGGDFIFGILTLGALFFIGLEYLRASFKELKKQLDRIEKNQKKEWEND